MHTQQCVARIVSFHIGYSAADFHINTLSRKRLASLHCAPKITTTTIMFSNVFTRKILSISLMLSLKIRNTCFVAACQWCSTRVRQCTRIGLESIFLRTRTRTRMQRTRTRTLRTRTQTRTRTRAITTQTRTQTAHWDSMFKKIQLTFSISFLNSNYLVSLQYQYVAGYCRYSQWLCQGYTVHMS